MTMREKMARAFCADAGDDPDVDGFLPDVPRWRAYLGAVDAALAAPEEPTEAMLDAGFGSRDEAGAIWDAMIGAAKGAP